MVQENSKQNHHDAHETRFLPDSCEEQAKQRESEQDMDAASAVKKERRRLWKNNVSMSVSVMLQCLGFNGLQALQSSLHRVEGLGVISLALLYGSVVLSCLFLPTIFTGRIGWKRTMIVSEAGYLVWMAANMYAVWGTMVPASVLAGLVHALFWTAHSSYLTECGLRYAALTRHSVDAALSKMMGLSIMLRTSSGIWGNIISSLILRQRPENATSLREEDLARCGARFCPYSNSSDTSAGLVPPAKETVWTLVAIYMCIVVLAMIILVFLVDDLEQEGKVRSKGCVASGRLLVATMRLLVADKRMILVLPLAYLKGAHEAFLFAEFTQGFVACTIGIWNVGFVLTSRGVMCMVGALLAGYLASRLGRVAVFASAFTIYLTLCVILRLWSPHPGQAYVMYIVAGVFGIGQTFYETQVRALYGVLFKDNREAGFSNLSLWSSVGFVCVNVYSEFICMDSKIYVLFALVILCILAYASTEILEKRASQHTGITDFTAASEKMAPAEKTGDHNQDDSIQEDTKQRALLSSTDNR